MFRAGAPDPVQSLICLIFKSSQFMFLRNYNKYTIHKDVIYKIKLNRNIPSLS